MKTPQKIFKDRAGVLLFEETIAEITAKARAKNIGAGIHNLPKLEQEIKWRRAA